MIITVVGAGGKTTVSITLGRKLAQRGFSVLFTTTTHIRRPADMPVYIGMAQEIKPHKGLMAAAREETEEKKLKGFASEELDALELKQVFENIIVEGDGAKERPVKAPADWEPVYPLLTALTIGVIGLDCLGKPAKEEFVHRPELFCQVTGARAGEPVTCAHLLALIQSPQGLFRHAPPNARKVVFLNKEDQISGNKEQVEELIKQSVIPVLITGRDTNWPNAFISKYIPDGRAHSL